MNLLLGLRVDYCFLLAGLLLASCSQGDAVQNPVVTFDGENCSYEGPEVVSEGDLIFVFKNLSDKPAAHLHVNALVGTTWEDILELAAKGPITAPPGGMKELYGRYVEEDPDAERYTLEPGSHGIFCVIHGVNGWPAAALEFKP